MISSRDNRSAPLGPRGLLLKIAVQQRHHSSQKALGIRNAQESKGVLLSKRYVRRPKWLDKRDGKRFIAPNGFWVIDGQYEHRLIYEQHHGSILRGWVIHHIDGVKTNNHIDNLIALPQKFHGKLCFWIRGRDHRYNRQEIESLMDMYEEKYLEIEEQLGEYYQIRRDADKKIKALERALRS